MKKRLLLLVALMAACLFIFAGCGASGPTEEDIIGTWQDVDVPGSTLYSDLEESGMYSLLVFEEDHTFEMQTIMAGEIMTARAGTWSLEDGVFSVHCDAGEDMVIDGSTYSSKAIDEEVTIDEDGMLTLGSSSGSVYHVAKKLSDSDLDELIALSEENGPKDLAVGSTVSNSVYTITPSSMAWKDEIYPSDTSGYYMYYPDESGYTYLVTTITFTNEGTDFVNPCYAMDASYTIDGNTFSAEIEMDCGDNYYSMYGLDPKDTGTIIIWASVSDSLKGASDISLALNIPDNTYELGCYYNSSMDLDRYIIK